MKYDRIKVEVIQYLDGTGGISFVEFRDIETGKTKILKYQNFISRYGIQVG